MRGTFYRLPSLPVGFLRIRIRIRIRMTHLEGGNGCPPDRRARPALRAHVCRSQETGCVIGTALVQNHGRYEASPHAHTHLPAFLIGVCTGRLSWSAEPVRGLQLASDAFDNLLHESMRATRAWIQANDARMHPKPAAATTQAQQTGCTCTHTRLALCTGSYDRLHGAR